MKSCMGPDDSVLSTPAWRYRMLHVAHRTATDALLEKHGVKDFGHPFILFLLEHCGDDGSFEMQKELSKRLNISPASVTAALKALERQGCIVREAQESDMRRKRIWITAKGREVARRYREVFTEVDEAMYSGFSEEELASVSAFFKRITENLQKLAGQEDAHVQKDV